MSATRIVEANVKTPTPEQDYANLERMLASYRYDLFQQLLTEFASKNILSTEQVKTFLALDEIDIKDIETAYMHYQEDLEYKAQSAKILYQQLVVIANLEMKLYSRTPKELTDLEKLKLLAQESPELRTIFKRAQPETPAQIWQKIPSFGTVLTNLLSEISRRPYWPAQPNPAVSVQAQR